MSVNVSISLILKKNDLSLLFLIEDVESLLFILQMDSFKSLEKY